MLERMRHCVRAFQALRCRCETLRSPSPHACLALPTQAEGTDALLREHLQGRAARMVTLETLPHGLLQCYRHIRARVNCPASSHPLRCATYLSVQPCMPSVVKKLPM